MAAKTDRPMDIAIVGMACRFPGARDLGAFWENVVAARDCTGDVPADRWDPAVFFDPDSKANDRVYCRRGGYLDSPIEFDPMRHGVMPIAVEGGEPEQFLVLDAARAALADAGMAGGVPAGGRVEVVIGRGNYFNRGNLTRLQHGRIVAQTLAILRELHPDWADSDFEAVRHDLKASLPPFEPATIAGQLTNATAGRIADRLDLRGASYVVDAASASSLVALDLGARALLDGRADLALVGGVYLAADVDFPMVFCQLGALSRRGQARPFCRDADGTLPGEGVGVVVLKRLRDAERDADRIYAVVKGLGLASDGRGRGLAAPSARGHARAIRRAYRRAGVDPATVDLVEGHGLGVPASDLAELRALRAVFPPSRRGRRVLGAVSATIGHAMPAAGIAALIKTALALHNRVMPPSPHADDPHPLLRDEASPFHMNRVARPWVHGDRAYPRRAGVNAFGFAGISAHAVLEEHAPSADGPDPGPQPAWETEAILLGADDRRAWLDRAEGLLRWLGRDANLAVPIKDLAYTLNTGAESGPFRVGMVVRSAEELRDRLRALVGRLADPSCRSIRDARGTYFWERPLSAGGGLAFLFPGEGSQYPGMLADLCPHFPEVRERFDIADRVARDRGYARLPSDVLFGGEAEADEGLWSVGTATNVVLSSQWALYQLLRGLGLRPDAFVGHSSGEFLAMAAAGAMTVDRRLEEGLGQLGRVFEQLEESGRVPAARLVAVAADRDRVERACRELGVQASIAIDNCPHQVVVAGPAAEVDPLTARLRGQGLLCEPLPFERAYHTAEFAEALGPVREFFEDLPLAPPRAHLYTCALARRLTGGVEQIRRVAAEQWALPVAFRATVEAMYADGLRVFVEVGARGNLTGFVDDILRDRPHFAVAANLPRRSGLTQLNHLAASLFAQGVPLDAGHLYVRRRPVRVDLDRDLAPPKPGPALAVGFPEMSLSPELAARLREREGEPLTLGDDELPGIGPRAGRLAPYFQRVEAHREPPRPAVDRKVPAKDHDVVPASPPDALRPHLVPEAPSAAAAREQAVLAHLRTMDAFLETQRQVMGAFWASRPGGGPSTTRPCPAAPAEPAARTEEGVGPWVGTVRSLVPGRSLMAERSLDVRDDPVAESHTLGGRRVSALDPSLKGLPVVPFTVMTEMLAQAAAVLVPGAVVVAFRDVQAHKWIKYEEEPTTLELKAERDPSRPDEVRVAIVHKGKSAGRDGEPVVEGKVIFRARREPGRPAHPMALEGAREFRRFTIGEVYADQWLFHGPAMQALVGLGRSAPRGIEGTLRVLPRRGLLRASEDPSALRTDPIVLDAFTQLLGCWGLDQLAEGDVIFPLRVAEIAFFGADPPEGSEVACRIAIEELSRHLVRVGAEIVRPDGNVWVSIKGWEDWRFHWPSRCRDQFRQPERFFVGEPLALSGAAPGVADATSAVWMELPGDLGKPVWRDVLEVLQFGPDERRIHRPPGLTEREWTLRLWERVAAKEAARRLACDRGEGPVFPADLATHEESRGHLRIESRIRPESADLPTVAVAHADGVAVAIASVAPDARPGIAISRVGERSQRDEHDRLAEPDHLLLASIAGEGPERAEWRARLECARDAVRSVLRRTNDTPERLEVIEADGRSGDVKVALGRDDPMNHGGPGPFRVVTARRGEFVWGWTLAE